MRVVRLETTNIRSAAQLRRALDQLMDYPEWYGATRDEWIDLVSYFDRIYPPKDGYRDGEFYMIELVETKQFLAREPQLADHLFSWIADVNKQYIKRTGRPVLAVAPLLAADQ